MYDLAFFRSNLDAIAKRLADRGFTLDVEAFREKDMLRRGALAESEALKARRNAETRQIGELRRAGQDTSERQQNIRKMDELMAGLEVQAELADQEFREMLAGVPNLPHESVPTGRGSEDNVEVRRWGTPP